MTTPNDITSAFARSATIDSNQLVSNLSLTGTLTASGNLALPGIVEYNTTSANANLVMLTGNGQVGYDATIFYDNVDGELHIGNLVMNDNPIGVEIRNEQSSNYGGYIQFTAGGLTPFTIKPIGSVKYSYPVTTPANIPSNGLGDMYFNNDAANGVNGFYLSKTSNVGGWDKIITASGLNANVVQIPSANVTPTPVRGGIYYSSGNSAFYMCVNGTSWQQVNLT